MQGPGFHLEQNAGYVRAALSRPVAIVRCKTEWTPTNEIRQIVTINGMLSSSNDLSFVLSTYVNSGYVIKHFQCDGSQGGYANANMEIYVLVEAPKTEVPLAVHNIYPMAQAVPAPAVPFRKGG